MANDHYDNFFSKYSNTKPTLNPVGTSEGTPVAPSEPLPKSRAMAADKVPNVAQQADPVSNFLSQAAPQPVAGAEIGPQPQQLIDNSVMSDGSEPMAAIADSPLGLMDRARLGWVRTPAAQHSILEDHYGKGNVQLVTHGDNEAGFVVKDKDQKWYQVDPHLSWKNLGPLSYPEISGENVKKMITDAPGDVTQLAGEYGLRLAGAVVADTLGAPLIAASGPFAPVTAVGLAGLGAAGGEALNIGLKHLSNPELDPKSAEDVSKQLTAAFLFGATQEAGGQAFKIGGKAVVGALATTLKAISDTPTGRYLASKAISTISGQPEALARVRVDDPMGVAKYDSVAIDDAVNTTNKLGGMMKDKVQGLYDDFQKRKQLVFGKQYDAVEAEASTMNFDPMKSHKTADNGASLDPTTELMQELTKGGYLKDGKPVDYKASKDVERMLTANEAKTLSYVNAQVRNVANKTLNDQPIQFQEMKNMIGTLDRVLYEQDGIGDPNLRRVLGDYRRNLKNNVIDTIAEKNPDLAKKYVELDQKYVPAKNLLESMSTLTEDQKVDGFMKQITKQDGTFNSDLISNLSDLLGTKDPTAEILKMHVAKNSTDFIQGRKFMKIIPGSPYMASRAVTAISATKAPVKPIIKAGLTYGDKALQFVKNLPASQRVALLADPEAIKVLGQITTNAAQSEQADTERMLQEAGVPSQ